MSEPPETDVEDDPEEPAAPSVHSKNYMTPGGFAVLRKELQYLLREERPKIVEVVSWAAGNGDRSENGDYIYGKKRLREIDRRVRYLTKNVESAVVVDPRRQQGIEQVFFGATVTYARADGNAQTVRLVGVDEADLARGTINWLSPAAQALLKKRVGDTAQWRTPAGLETVTILDIDYVLEDLGTES